MKMTHEESVTLSIHIECIKSYLLLIDKNYLKLAADTFIETALRQQAMHVLNPTYSNANNELLLMQGNAMQTILKLVEQLQECERLKLQVAEDKEKQEAINKMFV